MDQAAKNSILKKAQTHLQETREAITQRKISLRGMIEKGRNDFKKMSSFDKQIQMKVLAFQEQSLKEADSLDLSPYFARCDVLLEGKREKETLYFAKFPFTEKSIYSWVAPAAALRFENPGDFSYALPGDKISKGILSRKDQYMITDGKIIFFATETRDNPRELVYQEYFSSRKSGFMLPEIVEIMEKAQDQVIRAYHAGPFVIAGPAGSGKTTLALHRVAYLTQSPDVSQIYKSETIIVFVQDNGTKEYFSRLLPELGINGVEITTFAEWALKILNLENHHYIIRCGAEEKEKDDYERAKLRALKNAEIPRLSGNIYKLLEKIYGHFLNGSELKLWRGQEKEKTLDRFDLTILLKAFVKTYGELGVEQEYYKILKNGNAKKMTGRFPLEYSLIIVDEFQNYLPDQLSLIKSCSNKKHKSVLYVGDAAQQINFGTIREWYEIGENIGEERKAVLQKVYRNTRSILKYIGSLGYEIEIPEGIREGTPVVEKIGLDKTAEIEYIKDLISKSPDKTFGILAKSRGYLAEFKNEFVRCDNAHFLSMREAQGVEFDIVCLVGADPDDFFSSGSDEEKKRINKDLLYVALTRAISELHVLGKRGLGEK